MADSPSSLQSTESYLAASLNLSDVTAATARTNLAVLAIANNLSDLNSAATARTNLNVTRCLFESFADVGNVGTGEDDLRSHTLAAGQLAANGDKLRIFGAGTCALHATNTRQLKLYFGGTAVWTTNNFSTTTAQFWNFEAELIRVSASAVRVSSKMIRGPTAAVAGGSYAEWTEVTGLTLANTQVIKWTGAISAGADNDITQKQSSITYIPAA